MRVPQYPQKGSPLSAGFVHRGHRISVAAPRGGEELRGPNGVGGTAVRAAVADPDAMPALWGAAGVGSLLVIPAALWAPIWAAEAVIGFPQSMQNREVASLSRPQNEQTVNRHPPRRKPTWRANIGPPFGTSQWPAAVHSH